MDYRELFQQQLGELRRDPAFVAEKVVLDVMYAFEEAMRENGVSRGELAERVGVSRAYVSEVLNGKPNMTLQTLCKFAVALGLDVGVDLRAKASLTLVDTTVAKWHDADRCHATSTSPPRTIRDNTEYLRIATVPPGVRNDELAMAA